MAKKTAPSISRRRFLKTAGATALAAGAGPAVIIPGRAQPKTLKILAWKSLFPAYIPWFNEFANTWGEQNNIQVLVEWVSIIEILRVSREEVAAQQGHDIVFNDWPLHQDQNIDHREVYEEAERHLGPPVNLAIKDTYDPLTKRFHGVGVGYAATPVIYRKDLWDTAGRMPETWNDIRLGGRQIKFFHERPLGIGLAGSPHYDSEASMRAILYSFGGSEQDANDQPALKSPSTLEAIRFVKSLYEEAMTEEALTWKDSTYNNRLIVQDEVSLVMNAVNALRAAEKKSFPVAANQLWLAKAPQGPVRRLAPKATAVQCAIWKFAQNIDAAKQFIVDFAVNSRHMFSVSEFFYLPCFPKAVADMAQLLAHDDQASPPGKYRILEDASEWTVNWGYPGTLNRALQDVADNRVIPAMFANAATGKMPPDEAMTQADQEIRKIFDKWRALGRI